MWIAAILILAVFSAGCAQNPVPEPFPQAAADAWVAPFAAHDAPPHRPATDTSSDESA
jgi:hypothetical protein